MRASHFGLGAVGFGAFRLEENQQPKAMAMTAEATRMSRVHPSPSTVAAGRARELRAQGVAVLDLTVGEPDFDTPDNVKAAGIAAIERGDTKFTSARRASSRGALNYPALPRWARAISRGFLPPAGRYWCRWPAR